MRTQPAPDRRVWRNWAGTATATPARWSRPRSEAEISAAVKDAAAAGLTVRALGSGHSFTAAEISASLRGRHQRAGVAVAVPAQFRHTRGSGDAFITGEYS